MQSYPNPSRRSMSSKLDVVVSSKPLPPLSMDDFGAFLSAFNRSVTSSVPARMAVHAIHDVFAMTKRG